MNITRKAFPPFAAVVAALLVPAALAGDAEPFRPSRVTIEYTEFASQVRAGGQVLPLRGGGMVEVWSFDVYTAALYVPEDKKAADDILSPGTPRVLVINYHRRIGADDLAEATTKGFDKNPGLDRAALAERTKAISGAYSTVNANDRYIAEWLPERGTMKLYLNGKEACEIAGGDFAAAYFGIWVGAHALDSGLSAQLQGLDG
jgi:hypothetical protein